MARSPAKRFFGTLLFLIAVLVAIGFYFIVYAASVNDDSIPFTERIADAAIAASAVLGGVLLMLLLLLAIRRMDRREEEVAEADVFFIPEAGPEPTLVASEAVATEYVTSAEVTVYSLAKVPVVPRAWGAQEKGGSEIPYYFPRSIPSGLYINDYLPIDNKGTALKLRTLMAGPEDPEWTDYSKPRSRRPAARSAAVSAPRPLEQAAVSAPRPLEPTAMPAPYVGTRTRSGPSELLLRRAEEREASQSDVYYDYPGDSHEVEDLEGIGAIYGDRLREAGVHTTARLCAEDARTLADKVGVPRKTVEQWKAMAELVKIAGVGPQYAEAMARSGIAGIAELKKRSAEALSGQVNGYMESLDTNILGNKITSKRVESWQASAKGMRRIRMKIPER